MEIVSFEPLAKAIAIHSINGYQKYISPAKGFSCPYRRLHGGDSCSNYVKRMLNQQNLAQAVKSSRQRFRDCATASKALANSECRFFIIPCCLPL
jgi:putative component of membrane protein insertase Oxa1/YidC/SpoIIIJ protein YidD